MLKKPFLRVVAAAITLRLLMSPPPGIPPEYVSTIAFLFALVLFADIFGKLPSGGVGESA